MKSCPFCQTEIGELELSCQSCASSVSQNGGRPQVANIAPSPEGLAESYETWLLRGRNFLSTGQLEEACQVLREAVKRSRVLDNPQEKEIEARKLLAEALEKLGKTPEAADQYRIMAQEADSSPLREHWLKKSQDLLAASSIGFEQLFKKEEFRDLLEQEIRYLPLYCKGCKRLLAEAEVYGFRKGFTEEVRCWCGIIARPLAKEETRKQVLNSDGEKQRSSAIKIAAGQLDYGKKQSTACFLAFTTGWCGGHKFYLGEATAGWIYLFWFWTLVPLLLSIYEGIVLCQMAAVTFNMTYNLDLVLSMTMPEGGSSAQKAGAELFSLDSESARNEEVANNGTGRKEV